MSVPVTKSSVRRKKLGKEKKPPQRKMKHNIGTINNGSVIPSPNGAPISKVYTSIKTLSLNHLTAKQHLLMAICRDVSLLPPIIYIFASLRKAWDISFETTITLYEPQSLKETLTAFWQTYIFTNITFSLGIDNKNGNDTSFNAGENITFLTALITARASEHFLCSLWCLVSLYLTYAILDSLMVRWIVKYSTVAAIMRMFSMSLILITLELLLVASLSPEQDYFLHTWILISCILTVVYIWQSYLTSDLNDNNKHNNHKNGFKVVDNFVDEEFFTAARRLNTKDELPGKNEYSGAKTIFDLDEDNHVYCQENAERSFCEGEEEASDSNEIFDERTSDNDATSNGHNHEDNNNAETLSSVAFNSRSSPVTNNGPDRTKWKHIADKNKFAR
ncbi:Eos1p NDAI_0F02480, partial [Naumovozyma dairenensis CBS 421]